MMVRVSKSIFFTAGVSIFLSQKIIKIDLIEKAWVNFEQHKLQKLWLEKYHLSKEPLRQHYHCHEQALKFCFDEKRCQKVLHPTDFCQLSQNNHDIYLEVLSHGRIFRYKYQHHSFYNDQFTYSQCQ